MNSVFSPPSQSTSIFNHRNSAPPPRFSPPSQSLTVTRTPRTTLYFPLRVSSSSDNPVVTVPSPTTDIPLDTLRSASDVVKDFYDGINRHDLASVEGLIADNCVYEDLIFSRPFVGRKDILLFFKKFNDSISKDLQFVIDDISTQDPSAVGVLWHLEWKGKEFPFSKGCSFYRLVVADAKRQIIYARDSVEPAFKPGEMALDDFFSMFATSWDQMLLEFDPYELFLSEIVNYIPKSNVMALKSRVYPLTCVLVSSCLKVKCLEDF